VKRYLGPTYYGHPYLDGRGIFPDGHPLDHVTTPRGDEDLSRHDPPWTKQSHPYCYDPLTIWGKPSPDKTCNGTVYTDRLEQWDRSKYDRLAKKHYQRGENSYAQPFDTHYCKGDLIEAFLRDWYDDPKLKLLRVIEYCHPYTGYQTWRLDYSSAKEQTA
jgi:hypothetical protein